MTPPLHGFDVAHYNVDATGHFPWAWSYQQGHRLAGFKATQGTSFVDPQFAYNRWTTTSLGFRWRGMYAWIEPGKSIQAQITKLANTVGALGTGEFVMLDCEQRPLTAAQINEAWQRANAVWPFRVVMYCGAAFNEWTTLPALRGIPWWLPWYGPTSFDKIAAKLPWRPTLWQWGGGDEGATVPGVVAHGGRCDSNQIIRQDELDRVAGIQVSPPVPPKPPVVVYQEDPAMYVLDSDTKGSCLVTLFQVNGEGKYHCRGFDTPTERAGWAAGLNVVHKADADYLAFTAGSTPLPGVA